MKSKNISTANIKILICCHKPCELPRNLENIFIPIHVGAAISNWESSIQRDDQLEGNPCNNISKKNKSYCELTAMYWAWKNLQRIYPNTEYIGLCHYRRYFSFNENSYFVDSIIKKGNEIEQYELNLPKLYKLLKKSNIILSKKRIYPYSIDIDYKVSHVSEDMKILQQVIHELYPEYDVDMYKILLCNNKFSPYNMFIMKWKHFDNYCSWLFLVLEECERRINITNYSDVQKRIWGYMAERLLNVWVHHNIRDISFLNIIQYGDSLKRQSWFCSGINNFRKECSFLLGRIYNLNLNRYKTTLDNKL